MSQVTIAIAAELTGKSRETINLATRSGELSFSKNERNHKVVDLSELARVFPLVKTLDQVKHESASRADKSAAEPAAESASAVATLHARIEHAEELIAMLKEERHRERQQLESEIEHLRVSLLKTQAILEKSQEQQLLLTDQSQRDRERVADWQSAIDAIEQKIAQQQAVRNEPVADPNNHRPSAAVVELQSLPWWRVVGRLVSTK